MTMTINGIIRPASAAPDHVTIRVNDTETSWSLPGATPHEAVYSAAIEAMFQADAAGVTHLTLQTPANLVRRQVTGEWATESPALRRVSLIYELFRIDFDDVDWIKGPA
ncbi:hypothetical protein ASE86_07520 [Sphingomonas sp. Leaf33]|nr:hypothetical protein ASE86_07520 [Sphingomonas sp. Leaf33]